MNLHIPQTEEARAEAEILMQVPTQIISPRYGLSIIGCNQDSQTGMFILSQKDFKLTREEAIDLLAAIGVSDFGRLPDKEIVLGREVISVLIPKDFNFSGVSKKYKENKEDPDAIVKIDKGHLKSGVLDSANLGMGQGLLLRNIYKQYGPDFASDFLGKIFKLGNAVLAHIGFTTGISDIDVNADARKQIKDIIDQTYVEVDILIKEFKEGTLETLPGRNMQETLELRILEKLNRARNRSGKIVADNAQKDKELMLMIQSGGAGNLLNLAQMAACVGQQAMRGGRISRGYDRRTLSVFKKDDLGPAARGFIKEGFRDGLKPHELFFMSMTGRDSLMDTALRTPKSGYLYRRLANAMQDLRIANDYTVRDASNKVVQFVYGEDGVDVTKSEGGKINVKRIIDRVMNED
jgi:DNA-directed RNA polymerase subunit A'